MMAPAIEREARRGGDAPPPRTAGPGGGQVAPPWRSWMTVAHVVAANANPVVGVWFLGWQPVGPIFFYWLDGLLAIWGLAAVAAVVTSQDLPGDARASAVTRGFTRAAAGALLATILAVPSVVTGLFVVSRLHRGIGEILREVFASSGALVSLGVVVWSYVWQTTSELRWRPDLTIKESGEGRANLFIHRTLAMAFLAFWGRWNTPTPWVLGAYVLAVACLFTFAQLYPERYLRAIGFKATRQPGRRPTAAR